MLFCRFTQLGLLRLLSAEAVMGDELMNQRDAWSAYDRWLVDERVELLAAFPSVAQLTLVTFDRAMRGKVKPIVVLGD